MRNFIVLVLLCTCHAVEEQQQPTQQHQSGQQQQQVQVQSAQHYPHIQQQPQINYPQQPTHYPYPPYRPQSQQKMPAIPQQQSTDGVQQHYHQQGQAPYHTQTTTHQIVISEVKQLVPHYPETAAESVVPPHIINDKVQQLQQHVKEVMHQVGHHIPQVIKYQHSLQQNVPQSGHHNHVGVPSLSQETETAGVQQPGTQQHHVAIGMTQQHASQAPEGQSLKRDRRATPTTQDQKVPQQQQRQQQNQQLSGNTKKTKAVKGPAASTTKAPIISQEQDKTQNRVTKTMPQQQQSLKSIKKTRALNTPTTTTTKSSNVASTTQQHEQQQQENVVKRTRRAVQSTVPSTITTPTPIHVHQPLIKKVSQSDGRERKQRGVFEPQPQQQHHQHKPNHGLPLTKPPHPTKCQHDHHVTQPPKSKPQDVHHAMDYHQQHLPQHIMPPFKPYGGDHAMPPYHEHPKVESHHEDSIFPGHHHEMYPHSDHFH